MLSADLAERQARPADRPPDSSVVRRRARRHAPRTTGRPRRAWVEPDWGGLDLLVNNAGVAGGGRIERCSIEDWQWIFDVNLFGVVRGTRAFVPMLKAQGSGRIVNTASLAGLVHPPGMGSYNAVKAAVVAFSETAAHELAPYGVGVHGRVPVVLPDQPDGLDARRRRRPRGADRAGWSRSPRSPPTTSPPRCSRASTRGDELIVPDEPARAAYALKLHRPGRPTTSRCARTAPGAKERGA